MNNYQLYPEDIHLIEGTDKTIFLHIESLQMYPLVDKELLSFLDYYKNNGYEKTKNKYTIDNFNYIYNYIIEKICNAPKSISQDTKEDQIESFDAIVLPISSKCNLNCPYCFAQIDGGFNFKDFEIEDITNVLDFVMKSKNSNSKTNIIFLGGEPMLNLEGMKYTIQYIKEKYSHLKTGYSITTNGTILNDDIIKLIHENNFGILISIDGPDNEFNLRKFRNGERSIEKVLKNINILKSNDVDMDIRATLTSQNTSIVNTFDFLESLQIPFVVVFAYSSENKSHNHAQYDKNTLKSIKNQLDDLLVYYLEKVKRNEKIYNKFLFETFRRFRFRLKQKYICGSGIDYFTITSDGTLFSCPHLMNNTNYAIGNISEGVVSNAGYVPVNVDKIKDCQKCWIKYFCVGGCVSQKISDGLTNKDSKIVESCELDKISWEMHIKLYYEIMKIRPDFFHEIEKANNINSAHC